jgi:hypothetical protein
MNFIVGGTRKKISSLAQNFCDFNPERNAKEDFIFGAVLS